ncbi:hypothetical protein Y032_0043g831 [Ancylostoma ceylanicum]|uniref:Uncharacterized protein n=1 Tax=Ancylostoma ceylanicum TaxID=53326 RepID=A0A016UFF6_9BILA|nr:hypothetical protein Y032_0043g831 [Ancylostoma ceylanicum]
MFPVMDESERDFLRAAVRLTYSSDDEDSSPSSPSCERPGFVYNRRRCTEKPCSPHSPATDSGRPNSDDEDKRLIPYLFVVKDIGTRKTNDFIMMTGFLRTHPCSTKSLDDGFFDSSFHKKEEDTPSEALTSISNLQKIADNFPEEEVRNNHLSILEKNARVMRWIHGCAVPTVNPAVV